MKKDKKDLLNNISSQIILQVANYILPLVSVSLIVRIIGVEKFGLINYANSVISYYILIINYGFDLSASRKIAQNKENQSIINEIFCNILTCKLLLLSLCSITFAIHLLFIQSEERSIYIFTYMICFSWVITPNWLYQGMQNIKVVSAFNVLTKIISTIAIIVYIENKNDFFFQPLAISVAQIVVGIFSFYYAKSRYNLKAYLSSFNEVFNTLKEEAPLFLSIVVISFYTTTNTIILGLITNKFEVGYYSAASRFIVISQSLILLPLSQSLYPYIGSAFGRSTKEGLDKAQKVYPLILFSTLLYSTILFTIGPLLIRLFYGSEFEKSALIFRIMAIIPSLISMSNLYGVQVLLNLKQDKVFFKTTSIGAVSSLFVSLFLAYKFGAIGSAITWVLTELLILILLRYNLSKLGVRFHLPSLSIKGLSKAIKTITN